MASESFSRRARIIAAAAGIGLGLSVTATILTYRWEISRQQSQFQQQIENLTTALQRSLNRYTSVLLFLGDYYTVNQGKIERQDFDEFAARSLVDYPGIQALEWAPLVKLSDRTAYEQSIQAQGHSAFQITELGSNNNLMRARDRPFYVPVTYIAPFIGNEDAFGFDINSSPARVAAIEPARDSGEIQATGRIRLVQEKRNQYGFLMLLPRYQTSTLPDSVAARRSQFDGVLIGVFRLSDVVEEALQGLSFDIDFELYDQAAKAEESYLGSYDAATGSVVVISDRRTAPPAEQTHLCPGPTSCSRTLTLGQRQWQGIFSPAADYGLSPPYATWAMLFTGLSLTGSLVWILFNLQRESDRKLRFFSMASHELRTPLSTISLSAESLQVNQTELSARQKQRIIDRIYQTAQQMGQQIADLLTLTRAEAGKLEFNPELLETSAFCQQVIETVQTGIDQPIQFTGSAHPVKAFWDKKLMRSLLGNLLSNSAKYSPISSPIQITLTSDSHRATLAVSDRGIGIPEVDIDRIQQVFQRGSNVGEVTGTGLGLAIVSICVALHRGVWTINSKEGQGTTVSVTLPLE
ncbi:MAG: CHASE domain-containing protein [Cyanobacteria bacterium P01_C01_bin.73]